jgi:hypothetical protein
MKTKIISFLAVLTLVTQLYSGNVSDGQISRQLSYTMNAGLSSITTNFLIGFLPPKAMIIDVRVLVKTAFDATTNNFLTVKSQHSLTNVYVLNYSLARLDAPFVTLTNLYLVESSNRSVPIYMTYSNTGATTNAAGLATVVVRYVQF